MYKRYLIFIILGVMLLLLVGWGCTRSEGGSSDSIIWGRVLSVGTLQPVASLRFSLDGENIFGATDETGYFRLAGIPAGNYAARFVKHGSLVSLITFAVTEEQAEAGATIQLQWPEPETGGGSLSGVIRDEVGTPIIGAEILIGRPDENIQLTHTGQNGAYSFDNLSTTGSYTLVASTEGYQPESIAVVLNPDAPDRVNLDLEPVGPPELPYGKVKGHVTNADGIDLPGAYVTVYPYNSQAPLYDMTGEMVTDIAGEFEIDGVVEGPQVLWVGKPDDGIDVREIYVTAGQAWEAEIVLTGEYNIDL